MNFIVYDLEATCWENPRHSFVQEVIEIGALKLNNYGEVESEFSCFVKPVYHPTLSPFCQKLTTITQEEVERADEFPKVVEDFQDWLGFLDNEEYLLCSWGNFDKTALIQDCENHKIESDWTAPHINLKKQYTDIKSIRKPIGLRRAVLNEGFEFTGTHHRGIDDALNLVKLFTKYLDEWQY